MCILFGLGLAGCGLCCGLFMPASAAISLDAISLTPGICFPFKPSLSICAVFTGSCVLFEDGLVGASGTRPSFSMPSFEKVFSIFCKSAIVYSLHFDTVVNCFSVFLFSAHTLVAFPAHFAVNAFLLFFRQCSITWLTTFFAQSFRFVKFTL